MIFGILITLDDILKFFFYMKRFISLVTRIGLNNAIKYIILRWLGLEHVSAEVDTMYFFLNQSIDITQIKPASDKNLRTLQKCNAELLRVLADYFNQNNLRYWLDFGTLLGAIRHSGSIPWDDDVDIAMPREDYNSFLSNSKKLLEDKGIEIKPCQFWIGVGFKHEKTGIWIDVFPYDMFVSDKHYEEAKASLKDSIIKRRPVHNEGTFTYYYLANENASIFRFHNGSTIFPLGTHFYEGYQLSIPNDSDSYLRTIYGNYMSLPKSGILHHSINGVELYNVHKNNGVIMENILDYLRGI